MKDKLALAGAVLGFLLAAMAIATLTTAFVLLPGAVEQDYQGFIQALAGSFAMAIVIAILLLLMCGCVALTEIFSLLSAFSLMRVYAGKPAGKGRTALLYAALLGTLGAVSAGVFLNAVSTPLTIALSVLLIAVTLAEAIVRILCIVRLRRMSPAPSGNTDAPETSVSADTPENNHKGESV